VILIIGAVVCFIEFLAIDTAPPQGYERIFGTLHLMASFLLLLTLILYISTWRRNWMLLLRVLFGGFLGLMIYQSAHIGMMLLR